MVREDDDGRQIGIMLRNLAPDYLFLVQEILDHLNAVPHLNLSLFGHGKHGTDQFPRLHVHERGNSLTRQFFEVASKASQGRPPG